MTDFKNYRKKPIVIQAKQMCEAFEVNTLEGTMKGKPGDYLIIGVKGEKYPCDREVFEQTYELERKKKKSYVFLDGKRYLAYLKEVAATIKPGGEADKKTIRAFIKEVKDE